MEVVGETNHTGTVVQFYPDAEIFTETTTFSFDTLVARLRELAFLNRGINISIRDNRVNSQERTEDKRFQEFYFQGGISSFVEYLNEGSTPIHEDIIYLAK